MTTKIQELIVMYAPTVFMAISTVLNYAKTFKALNLNVKNIEESSMLRGIKSDLSKLQEELIEQRKDNIELRKLNMELIQELSKVQKYEEAINECQKELNN